MKQIRHGIFESNSSSSHALVIKTDENLENYGEDKYITKEELDDEIFINKNNKIGLFTTYFGRCPFRILASVRDKIDYAFASGYEAELLEFLREFYPEVEGFHCEDIHWAGTDEPYLSTWMKQYNLTVKEFILNNKYAVIQDGDEYNIWNKFINSGLINMEATDNLNNKNEV